MTELKLPRPRKERPELETKTAPVHPARDEASPTGWSPSAWRNGRR